MQQLPKFNSIQASWSILNRFGMKQRMQPASNNVKICKVSGAPTIQFNSINKNFKESENWLSDVSVSRMQN